MLLKIFILLSLILFASSLVGKPDNNGKCYFGETLSDVLESEIFFKNTKKEEVFKRSRIKCFLNKWLLVQEGSWLGG